VLPDDPRAHSKFFEKINFFDQLVPHSHLGQIDHLESQQLAIIVENFENLKNWDLFLT
jgi:hypothetical protein